LTSEQDTGQGPGPVQLSAAAHRVAAIAAAEAGLPVANWIALAILGTAADQAGLASQAVPQAVPAEPDPVQTTLRRLEAKLDRALASQPDRAAGPDLD